MWSRVERTGKPHYFTCGTLTQYAPPPPDEQCHRADAIFHTERETPAFRRHLDLLAERQLSCKGAVLDVGCKGLPSLRGLKHAETYCAIDASPAALQHLDQHERPSFTGRVFTVCADVSSISCVADVKKLKLPLHPKSVYLLACTHCVAYGLGDRTVQCTVPLASIVFLADTLCAPGGILALTLPSADNIVETLNSALPDWHILTFFQDLALMGTGDPTGVAYIEFRRK